MNISKKNLILIGYFVLASILLLDCTNNFPGTILLRKFKYIYLLMLILDFFCSKIKWISKTLVFVLSILILHTVLFGLIFVNPTVLGLTRIHFREMIIYLVLLFFLANAVERYNCRLKFIEATCSAFAVYLIWCGITYFSHFVNPLYYIYVFNRSDRIRSDFGTGSPNYMGYYCFVALIFFFSLWHEYRQNGKLTKKIKYALLGISGWTVLILFSTGSRSSILSFLIFSIISFYNTYLKPRFGKSLYLITTIAVIVIICILYANWSEIWRNANREANITVNLPVFNQMNAMWKGMGYIESSGFYYGSYGYETWPVDIYYLYIFLSTGVFGTVIMSIPLGYILFRLIKSRDIFIRHIMLPAYAAVLFDGFWQVNIFTYRYIATLFIGVLLIISISLRDKYDLIGIS